jgi:hypothetical protein
MLNLTRHLSGQMTRQNGRQAPGLPWKIHHPHVSPPSKVWPLPQAIFTPLCTYVPVGYRLQATVESVRSGENLGADWPWNFTQMSGWQARRYNVKYAEFPADISTTKGIQFYAKLNVWCATWIEDGRPRFRYFRVQTQGFSRAKLAAEKFRTQLEASGRVDNRRTEREKKLKYLTQRKLMKLHKKRFAPLSKGLF